MITGKKIQTVLIQTKLNKTNPTTKGTKISQQYIQTITPTTIPTTTPNTSQNITQSIINDHHNNINQYSEVLTNTKDSQVTIKCQKSKSIDKKSNTKPKNKHPIIQPNQKTKKHQKDINSQTQNYNKLEVQIQTIKPTNQNLSFIKQPSQQLSCQQQQAKQIPKPISQQIIQIKEDQNNNQQLLAQKNNDLGLQNQLGINMDIFLLSQEQILIKQYFVI